MGRTVCYVEWDSYAVEEDIGWKLVVARAEDSTSEEGCEESGEAVGVYWEWSGEFVCGGGVEEVEFMKYDVILADPPWDFQVWNKDTGSGGGGSGRSASAHYQTMNLEAICNLPIGDLAEKNCALFIWTVYPRLFDTQKVIEAWGFTYKTLGFEWWKLNKKWRSNFMSMLNFGDHKVLEKLFFFGMGYYTRSNPEPCLLAVKGNMSVATRAERNFILAPIREHSRKPDEQYGKIERLYPNRKYLELFARHTRKGWDAFGNQVENSIALGGA